MSAISLTSRICVCLAAFAALAVGAQALWVEGSSAAGPCEPPVNAIVCENSKEGNSPEEWDVSGAGDPSIQGFATDISVNHGQTVRFKIKTSSTKYHLDIYRMGYYGGDGARKVATVQPSAKLPQTQPECKTEASSGLVDCGNWAESASWAVPSTAVSGIYFAKLVREDKASEGSHILFIVRDDGGHEDLLFQTADTTWEAYNRYGGNSLYFGGPATNPERAYKVSYNRPFETRGPSPEDMPFSAEYPMVRWLERNGYDVGYFTGVDADRRGSEILNHKAYLSVGHDEYWSGGQRANVEAARNAGVNLAFFSGNEIFWKTRWENSIDGSGTDHRTLVCYKETHANAKIDPQSKIWTGTWRDPRFSPPADGGRPENALSGTIFTVNSGTAAIEVPAAQGKMRLWRDTSVAGLAAGKTATLAPKTLGYEWDEDLDNGSRPPGLADLSSTTVNVPEHILDYGSNYGPATATHHLTLYRASSGALVFGAGTVQWSWGLDPVHDRVGPEEADPRMQQATVNLFADMGVQPNALQGDLHAETKSTDTKPPTTTITSPIDNAQLESGKPITVTGTATDAEGQTGGGRVAGVEVSTDGGSRWHPATGLEQWSYKWTPGASGSATVMARAVDDSANLEKPGDQASVQVIPHTCPCSIWDESVSGPQDPEENPIELGVKFRADTAGYITGLRFYKTGGNTGKHVGRLWTAAGTQLAQATFSSETQAGWQEISFDSPVQINANTTYVASYFAPHGHYAAISDYFSLVGTDSSPLHALADGVAGANGIYRLGGEGQLFEGGGPESFRSANYLVDVVFQKEVVPDTTPPQISATSPVVGAAEVDPSVAVSATFNEPMRASSFGASAFELRDDLGEQVAGSFSFNGPKRTLEFSPSDPLRHSTTYTGTIKGGAGGVADVAGNTLASNFTWSFTTTAAPPPPPDEGPGGPILVIANSPNPFSRYYAEILRAEGLNEYRVVDISSVTAAMLTSYDVAILGEGSLSGPQAQMMTGWVEAGGNLIAMRPSQKLAGLLGLTSAGGTLSNAYMKVDTSTSPGAGIVGETIQFHGTADRYTTSGAQAIATLYPEAEGSPSANPAVTLRSVGSNGGQAAAFSYDLARSVVYTRQGNRAWAGQERDGSEPVRSDDLFFGAKAGSEEPDWVDLNKAETPQADEQQRLLSNLIERMNADRKPLPRFWFLPRDGKAAVVMTGDDHGVGGTVGRFQRYEEESPSGCVVSKWECIRATSYIFPETPITDAEAAGFNAAGFEISLQGFTDCSDWNSAAELKSLYSDQLATFATNFPSLPPPATERNHCVVWSDWASQPKVESETGIRLDTNYYYWPGSWAGAHPGMFTGSGMPMRFADADGSTIDVYQAPTQLTDESDQDYPSTINTLLDNALGSKGYYGVFTADMHNDEAASPEAEDIVESAKARHVPVVSAQQMLTWLDGRNQSSFGSIAWNGSRLSFTIAAAEGATGLRAMLPVESSAGALFSLTREGKAVTTKTEKIKGIEYAFFDATSGSYTATYGAELSSTVPASPANNNSPKVFGSAPSGSTVRIYKGADCSGSPIATVSSTQLAAGVTVSVSDNTTTQFRVTATLTKTSPCSAPLTYVEDSSAPTAQVDGHPAAVTNSSAAKIEFSGSDGAGSGVASFECRRDAGAWGTCTSPQSYSGLSDGSHSFEVKAIDKAGNAGSAVAFGWSVDTTAPGATIGGHPVTPSGSAEAKFEFSGSDGSGSGVASFECRIDSSQAAAWGACTSPRTYGSLADGSHSFEARTIDKAGNTGAPASFNWTVDTVAPLVTVDSVSKALLGSGQSSEVRWHANENGSFQLRVGGSNCSEGTILESGSYGSQPAQHTSVVSAADLAEGANTLRICVTDAASNRGSISAVLSKDTAAPTASIDAHPQSLSNSAGAEFAFSGNDGSGSGVASFECRRDSTEASAWGSCSSPKSYASLSDGEHSFQARAIDKAGNVGSPATFSWTIDTVAPAVTIDSGPPSLTNDSTPTFDFHSSEPGSTFECSIDTGTPSWGPCSGAGTHTPASALADGPHTFRARATDAAKNQGTAATRDFTVDTAIPDAPSLGFSQPASPANDNSPKIIGSAPAGSTVRLYQGAGCQGSPLAGVPASQLTSGIAVSVPDDSSTAFSATATSAAQNTSPCSAPLTYVEDSSAPTTQIQQHPTGLTSSAGAKFEFSAGDGTGSGIASLECRIDSTQAADWSPCTSPKTYSGLADGSHTFEARAVDKAGNTGAPVSFSWTVDTTAPTATIDSHPPALTGSASAKFEFSGNDGSGAGVASLECRRDAGAWTPCTSPQTYNGLADGFHAFEVRAVDKAGNTGTPAVFDWTVDTTAPAVTIDKHPSAFSASPAAEFVFSGSDPGGSGVASFECRRDSTEASAWGVCGSPRVYGGLADGEHGFQVRAVDKAANTSLPATFNWTIDTVAPVVTIDSGPTGPTNDSTPTFDFHSSEPGSTFECSIDTGTPAYVPCSDPGSHTSAALSDGPRTVRVRATDAAGNQGVTTRSFAVDTTAPTATVNSHPSALTNSAKADFAFLGADGSGSGIASFECRKDAGAWTSCVAPQSYSSLADGAHGFEVRAIDKAGNTGAPATFNWTIDTTAPTATVDSHPSALTNSAKADFAFSGADGSGSGIASLECRLDSTQAAAWNPCTSPKAYGSLADGSHAFEARAVDKAGNTGAPASFNWTVDTTPPTTTIDSHPPALTNSAKAEFTFSGNDGSGSGIASFECRRDAGAWAPCTSPQTYSSLVDGAHSFEARAVDKASNTGAPVSFNWNVDTTVPTTTIDSKPAALSASAKAEFTFSGADSSGSGVASFECRIDSTQAADWSPCASPKTYSSLADGSHTFEVKAIDKAGNAGAPAVFSWTVDTTAPTSTIDSHPATLANSASAEFTFSGSDGSGSGITSFECRKDAGAWTTCTSPQSYAGLTDGAHAFEVKAIDKAGNIGAPASFHWIVDTTAPPTSIDSHPPTLTNSALAKFDFSANDGTGSGIASFECRRDAGAWAPCTSPQTYVGLPDGSHAFEVKAIDKAGNGGSAVSFNWTVDTTAPTASIDSHPPALTNSAKAEFTFSGNDGTGSGIASFECRRDAGAWAPCTSPQTFSSLVDGAHSFEARAVDKAGNTGAPASFNWSVDTTVPTTTIDSKPAALSASAKAEFTFSGADSSGSGVASFECRRDAGVWAPCTSPQTYTELADGSHTFEARAVDKAGNTGAPVSFNWAVDTTAPTTSIDSHPPTLTNSASAKFEFSANDGSGSGIASFECRRDTGSWTSCSAPQSYSSLTDGSHTFEVKAIDKAGNAGAPATFDWTVDTNSPTATVNSHPSTLSASAKAEFTFSGADGSGSGVAAFECRLDSSQAADWSPCASPKTYSELADGSHTFEARAVDKASNTGAPVSFSWAVDTTPPTTTIDSHPPALTNSASAKFDFSANDGSGSGITSYECRRDSTQSADWSPCISPKSYGSLGDGPHNFEVRAIDKAGNVGAPASFHWTVDTTAPATSIDSHPPTLTNSASAKFDFSANDGSGSGIASFECRRDAVTWTTCTSPQTFSSLVDGAHSFEVKAADKAGNAGAPAVFSWTVDTTAPTSTIDSHPATLANSASAEFTFSGSDGSGSGIASFECRKDAGAWTSCSTPQSYSSLTDGSHTFEVKAVDKAGNNGSAVSFGWTVDTTAPTTTIDSHPPTLSASAKADFAFSGADGSGSGITSYECRRDTGAWASCASPQNYSSLADGSHSFEVRAIDKAGNTGAPVSFSWTVDTNAPTATVNSHPSTPSASAKADFAFSANDGTGSGIASFECRIDSSQAADWSPCTSPNTYSSLSDGSHTFEVKAADKAGNAGAPTTFNWSVDTTAPTTTIDSKPAALSASAKAEFTFSGADGSGSGVASFECRLDSSQAADWSPCASPKTYSGLADGSHTFEVKAIDKAGNNGSAVSFGWTVDTTAPTASIDSKPSVLTNSAKAEFTFSGADGSGSGVAAFECRLDSSQAADWSPCTSPKTYTGLADGSHNIEARAIDKAGNTGAPVSFGWTVDTTAPDAPSLGSTQPASPANDNSPKIIGSAPAGSTVRLYQGAGCQGSPLATVPASQLTSGISVSVPDDSSTAFSATATSTAQNTSPCSAPLTYVEDSSAPTTQIQQHPTGLTSSAGAKFEFSAGDGTGSGIASLECRLDSTQAADWSPCTSPKSYSSLADGSHTFEARAVDKAGNTGAPVSFSWTVDTTAPTLSLDSLSRTLVGPGQSTEIHWHADENGTFELRVGGTDCTSGTAVESGPYSSQPDQHTSVVSVADLAEGANTLRLCLIDAASNRGSAVANVSRDTVEPTASIDSSPQELSLRADAQFTFSGNDASGAGVASFECRIDSTQAADWSPCTSPKSYSSLADGSHTFEVKAIDKAGNAGAPATFDWTVDTNSPTATVNSHPSTLSASAKAEFTFSGADGSGSGVAAFECRLDSSQAADWSPCASPKTYSGLADGSHTFEARAVDKAGNAGAPVSFSWTIDTTAPTASIDSHPPALTNSASAKFDFSGDDGSGSGITSYECRRDTGAWASCTSPQTFSSLADGAHSFEVKAADKTGNAGAPAVFSWTVDTTAPTSTIDSHPATLANSASAEFTFSGSDGSGSGIASFECRIDSTQSADWSTCTSPQSYSSLADGSHSFEARAIDKAGNTGAPVSFNWTVDTAAPAASIDSQPPALNNSSNADFAFSAADGAGSGIASLECRLDSTQSADWSPCASPKTYTGLADGSHSFEARAVDKAGNVGASASFNWTVDTTTPVTAIDSGPRGRTNSTGAKFAFSAGDGTGSGVASLECRLDSTQAADWSPCASPKSYGSLGDGPHNFEVRAIDKAGNVGAPGSASWTVDTAAPDPPNLSATVPASPANDNSPKVIGTAPADTTVRLFTAADCAGSALATVSAVQLEEGVTLSVADDTSTTIQATATSSAGNTSACSVPLTYVEDSSAPQAQIDGHPAGLVNSALATFVLSADDGTGSGVASLECRIDSTQAADWSPCTSPKTYTGLADGSHTFEARAIDKAGNTGAPVSFNWTVDTTAPTSTIDSHPATLANSASAEFTFSGSDGSGSGIASFECRKDAGAWTTCTSSQSYSGLADGSHAFEVKAVDKAGNVGAPATFNWTVDTTAPTATIDSHSPALANSASAKFEFSANDGSGSGIASFECRLDSTQAADWSTCASPKTYSSIADGSHTFEARAIDKAGNVGSAVSFNWTVDTAAPDAPSLGSTEPASPANDNSPKIIGSAPAGSTVRLYRGAGCQGSPLATVPASQLTSGIAVSVPDDSSTAFSATATSTAQNTSPCSAPLTYVEDSSAPQTQIDAAPAAVDTAHTAGFLFSASDTGGAGIGSYQCRIDSSLESAWEPCTSPKAYGSLVEGGHSFEVRALDRAGNVDATPALFAWTIKAEAVADGTTPSEGGGKGNASTEAPTAISVLLQQVRYNTHNGKALLIFKVSAPGRLSVSVPDTTSPRKTQARKWRRTSINVSQPGLARLPIKLSAAGRQQLLEGHRVRVQAKVTFKADDGTPISERLTIFLKLEGSESRPK